MSPSLARAAGAWVPATAVLLGGVAGWLPTHLAIAIAVGVAAAYPGYQLVRLSLEIHHAQHSYGPCRGAGFLGVGALAGALAVGAVAGAAPAQRPVVATGGLAVGATAYVLGLLLLPGAAHTTAARLRRAFDGLSIGVSLAFAAWAVMPHEGGVNPAGFAAALIAVFGLSIVVLAALRAVRYRPAAVLCGAGAALAILGLTGLATLLAFDAPDPALFVAAVPLCCAPQLAWTGAERSGAAPGKPAPADEAGTLAGYPILTVPAGLAAAAALWHLLAVGAFDSTSIVLGICLLLAITTRELLAAIDVRRYARRLSDREAHFRALVSGSTDVTMVIDTDLIVRWQSPAAARLLGLSDQDVLGRPFLELVHPDDVAEVFQVLQAVLAADEAPAGGRPPVLVEARLRDGFGAWRDTESTVSDQRSSPAVEALVVHIRDVGERKQLERTLRQLTFVDQLTGLPNRRELLRTLTTLRNMPGRTGAVLVIDLSGMAGVNDVQGREVGDAVLVEVARRLRTGVGPDDLPVRLGGDEFAVVTADTPVQAYALGTRLLLLLTEPYALPGNTVHLSATVGVAELATDATVDEILNRADLARRRARQLGRNRIDWYDESLEALLQRRMEIERDLPGAAIRGELDLLFQPIIELAERRPAGLEALLRWRHRTLGTVLPAELVPIADDLGVIGEIGDWVLHAACRQLAGWLRDNRDVWVSVNVSLRQLAAPDFVATVGNAVDTYRVPPDRLVVEIAESAVGGDVPTVITQLGLLRALGVRTAVDHFGVGPTSLAYLRRLPVDILKIDSALFVEAPTGPGLSLPIIDVVASLGRRLGLEIVAEGLEVEKHLEVVRKAGCRYGQGHLFGRPAPAEHVEAYIESYRALA